MTGGAGFIGSHLVEALIRGGWAVAVVDNLVAGRREDVPAEADFYECDVCDHDALLPVLAGADVVFHLAALPKVQFSIDEPHTSNDVNLSGTVNVLNAAKEGGVRRVIFSTSAAVYGDHETFPLSETLPPRPVTPYALQKYAGEEYARMYSALHGLETVSLRYFNVYGPRMRPDGAYGLVVAHWLQAKEKGLPLPITGDGLQTRDFVHVRDIVRANLLAAMNENVGRGEVINIGSGSRISMKELAELFGGPVEWAPARVESRHTEADNRKAKELLEWEPAIDLEEGIAELLADIEINEEDDRT